MGMFELYARRAKLRLKLLDIGKLNQESLGLMIDFFNTEAEIANLRKKRTVELAEDIANGRGRV